MMALAHADIGAVYPADASAAGSKPHARRSPATCWASDSIPDRRERFPPLLRPATSRLVIDLSLVGHTDASGLAVLVGTARRARLLGGSLRLAAPTPAMTKALRAAGLDMQLDIFPTVQSAIRSPAPA